MSLIDNITLRDWLFILIIILLIIKIWQIDDRLDVNNRIIEGFDGDTLSNEAIQNIASVYNQEKLVVTDLDVTGNLTVNGTSLLKGDLTANSVPSLTVGTFVADNNATIKGSATINGDTLTNGSATFKNGVHISGKHKEDNTPLTIIDPSGAKLNSHFYWDGNATYIGGVDAIYARTAKAPSGTGQRTLLAKGGGKVNSGQYNNMLNPLYYKKRYQQTSEFESAPITWWYTA